MDSGSKPTYEELEAACKTLEEQVANSVSLHQELIEARDKLDEQTNRFRLIQSYGSGALQADGLKAFLTLTVEYFAEAFEQPRIAFFEYYPEQQELRLLEQLGYEGHKLPPQIPFDSRLIKEPQCILLRNFVSLHKQFELLELENAMLCPFFDNKRENLAGLILSGYTANEKPFMAPIKESDRPYYSIMTQNAGLFLQNFRVLERLQEEILERRQVQKELLLYQQQLEESKLDLETKVDKRTRALAESNQQLQLEIEERSAIERELRRSNAELEEFAYIASHDLKAPLRSINSFTQLLAKRYGSQFNEEAKVFMDFIQQGVKRFDEIINDLLHYSRVFRAETEAQIVGMNDLLEVVTFSLLALIERTEAKIIIDPLPTLNVRKYEFEQLFQNLLENALKFCRPDVKPVVEITVKEESNLYIFSVKDNGIGIKEVFQEKVFGMFQRLHLEGEYEGTGVGLSICKKVVHRHGGKIWFQSNGEGTTFFFSVPRNLDASRSESTPRPPS